MTNEYTLTVHGTVKVKAESFKDIKIDEVLRLLGNDGNLTIENVEKKEVP